MANEMRVPGGEQQEARHRIVGLVPDDTDQTKAVGYGESSFLLPRRVVWEKFGDLGWF